MTAPATETPRMTSRTTPTAAPTPTPTSAQAELGDFPALTQRYSRELLAHCYRMSGSVH